MESSWKSPCNATLNPRAVTAQVAALQIIGNTLYIRGSFGNGAGIVSADFLLACDLTTGAPSSTVHADGDFNAGLYALTADSNGTLYAGGLFTNVEGIQEADHIAYYSGGSWHAMGSGPAADGHAAVSAIVRSLAAHALSVFGRRVVAAGGQNIGGDNLADYLGSYTMLRPDARIGTASAGPFTGNDVYSIGGVGEKKTISVARGGSGKVYADFQNDGITTNTLTVAAPNGGHGFKLRFFHGATNVTSQVLAGTHSTGNLAPGAHLTLKVVIKVARSSASSATFLISVHSQSGGPGDSVGVSVNAH